MAAESHLWSEKIGKPQTTMRDRYTTELYDGDVREKKVTKQDPRERDLLSQPAQGFHIIVLIQECYEHGSKWAIVLWGIDTGVRVRGTRCP